MISQLWDEHPRLPRAAANGIRQAPFLSRVRSPAVAVLGAMLVAITLLVAGVVADLAARCGFSHPQSAFLVMLMGLGWTSGDDLVAGRITVRQNIVWGHVGTPKSGKPREIPLGDEVRAALKAHRHLRGPLVFCDLDGRVLTEGETRGPLWRACKRAGLRPITWHVARHTFASHLVMRGGTMSAVQELLGHSTILMTMRYAHLGPEVVRETVRLLDGVGQSLGRAPEKIG